MSDFYEKHYGKYSSRPRIEAVVRLIRRYVQDPPRDSLRILDIGCGNGESFAEAISILDQRGIIPRDHLDVYGWDVSAAGVRETQARGVNAKVKDVTDAAAADGETSVYDLVVFSEMLEHLVDTGAAMRTIHKVLVPGGGLAITTPNLAAWYNRILLPLGFQPFLTELSFEPPRFGNAFFYRLVGEKQGINYMAGHLRVFSYRALKEFVRYFGFDIVLAMGIASHGDWLSRAISRCWTGGAGSIGLLAVKQKELPS